MPPNAFIKGAGLIHGFEWIRETHGEDVYARVLTSLPDDLQAIVPALTPSAWYPVALSDLSQIALVRILGLYARDVVEEVMLAQGRRIAENDIGKFYRFVLAHMTPEMLFLQMPTIWRTYFRNVTVSAERTGPTAGIVVIDGLRSSYMSVLGRAWTMLAFEQTGATDVRVSERSWDEGAIRADTLRYEVIWG